MCGLWGRNSGVFPAFANELARSICTPCAHSLRPVSDVRLACSLTVSAAFQHAGAIRGAIHALKYRGVDAVADLLAGPVARLVPESATALVPVPRAFGRTARYGIDQAHTLAVRIARQLDLPVVRALRAPAFRVSQTRRRRSNELRIHQIRPVPSGAVLVDDVVTTGATLSAARRALSTPVTYAVAVSRSTPDGNRSERLPSV